jgi:L-threonylcarbamoyladenylate synthase
VSHDTLLETRMLPAGAANIAAAARVLEAGGLAAFPTETVYGLGVRADDPHAVARLYAAKGRPAFNPLIAHVRSAEAAGALAEFNPLAERLAEQFWPGPLTLVLRAKSEAVCELARAGLSTVAVRVPSHPVAQALLGEVQFAIVAPSANRSGHVSPTTAQHVQDDLGGLVDVILDGGAAPVGIESTIVDCSGARPMLLRSGGIPREAIEAIAGPLAKAAPERISAPGMLASHYAPRATLRLDAAEVRDGEALLAFGPLPASVARAAMILNLSPGGDAVEAAANLYAHLRSLDASGPNTIAVAPIPPSGLGEAIRDRLQRAAAPR